MRNRFDVSMRNIETPRSKGNGTPIVVLRPESGWASRGSFLQWSPS